MFVGSVACSLFSTFQTMYCLYQGMATVVTSIGIIAVKYSIRYTVAFTTTTCITHVQQVGEQPGGMVALSESFLPPIHNRPLFRVASLGFLLLHPRHKSSTVLALT